MPTRNELRLYEDVHRISQELNKVAIELQLIRQALEPKPPPEPGSLPKLPQSAFNTERGPGHRE